MSRCLKCLESGGHLDQKARFPKESAVIALDDIPSVSPHRRITRGTIGKVTGHCDDGRAYLMFDDQAHTFHFPDDWIEPYNADRRKPRRARYRIHPWRAIGR